MQQIKSDINRVKECCSVHEVVENFKAREQCGVTLKMLVSGKDVLFF